MENRFKMTKDQLEILWDRAIQDLLNYRINKVILSVLADQTHDSIRRIEIYRAYKSRATLAVEEKRSFFDTSNPFVLAQRTDLSNEDRVWIIYLATYFGKSNFSGWDLFLRAAFDGNQLLITFRKIKAKPEKYFDYLNRLEFFENCKFSNHRKYTKKSLNGPKGFFHSMTFLINNMEQYCRSDEIDFQGMYKLAGKIPNFGRLASFDFSSSLVKCGLKIGEPKSMYASHSTGPLQALELILRLTNSDVSHQSKIDLSYNLVEWFTENSDIFMVGQVLEDAICNWQKNPKKYIYYSG